MRVRRSLWNFGTTLLLTGVTMTVGLVASPLLGAWLHPAPFGAARIVNDLSGYLTLLELGLSGALGPLTARALARDDTGALREVVTAGSRTYIRVTAWAVGVGLLLTPFVPWFTSGLSPAELVDFRWAWVVSLGVFLPMVSLPLRSVVEAEQRGYVINLWLTAQSLTMTGLALAFARAGWGITGQALAVVAGVWAFHLALALDVGLRHRGLIRHAVTRPAGPEARRALRELSLPALLLNVFGRLSFLTDNLVVSPALGTDRVTVLFFTQRLAGLGQLVLQGIGNATWAALAQLHAQGEKELFNRRLIELSRLTAVLAAAGLAPVVAYNASFFRAWAPAAVPYGGDLVVAVAAVNVALLALQSLWIWCFTATGHVKEVVPTTAAAAVLNLAASVALVGPLGLLGPLLGTTLGLGLVGLWAYPERLRAVYGTSPGALARAVTPALAWGVVSTAGLWGMTRWHRPVGFVAVALEMGLAALVSLAFSAAVLLPAGERALWRGRLFGGRASG